MPIIPRHSTRSGPRSPRVFFVLCAAVLGFFIGSTPAWAASGRISVSNDRNEPVVFELDHVDVGRIPADGRSSLSVKPGRHEVVLKSRSGQVLLRTIELVHPGSTSSVRLAALDQPVRIVNPLDRSVRLLIDGRDSGTLGAYGSRTLHLKQGRHELALRYDGRTIASESLRVNDVRLTWAPQVALRGNLVVANPLPIPVTLTCSRGLSRTVPAHGSTTYADVKEGPYGLTVRRAEGGERIADIKPGVRAFATVSSSVPAPSTGILAVDNERRRSIQVYVDGRYVAAISAGQVSRLELRPGRRELVIRASDGRVLERRTVLVDRYATSRVEVDGREDRRDDRHDHHQRPDDGYTDNTGDWHIQAGNGRTSVSVSGDSCRM